MVTMDPKEAPTLPPPGEPPEPAIGLGDDTLCSHFAAEVQEIYEAIRKAEGRGFPHGFWTADGMPIASILERSPGSGPTEAALRAVERAAKELGISLFPGDRWEEAAIRLRASRRK